MVNATITNIAVNATQTIDVATATQLFFLVLIPEVASRYFAFISAPFIYPEMWWLLFHLILTFVLFEFYFERHEGEDLGWSAALANSIVAIFISMELLRAMYHHEGTPLYVIINIVKDYIALSFFSEKTVLLSLIITLGLLGATTAIINYFHVLPRKVAFLISGHKTINLLAYFLIVVVWNYTHGHTIPIDGITITSALLFGATVWFALFMINHKLTARQAKKSQKEFFK